MLETSALEDLYCGQFSLSTQLIKPNCLLFRSPLPVVLTIGWLLTTAALELKVRKIATLLSCWKARSSKFLYASVRFWILVIIVQFFYFEHKCPILDLDTSVWTSILDTNVLFLIFNTRVRFFILNTSVWFFILDINVRFWSDISVRFWILDIIDQFWILDTCVRLFILDSSVRFFSF